MTGKELNQIVAGIAAITAYRMRGRDYIPLDTVLQILNSHCDGSEAIVDGEFIKFISKHLPQESKETK